MSIDKTKAPRLNFDELLQQFCNGSVRKRKSLISSIEDFSEELSLKGPALMQAFDPNSDNWSAGWILQVIQRNQPNSIPSFLSSSPKGWFKTSSEMNIDYAPFQKSLLEENFEEADRFTSSTLRKLAGNAAEERGYVYFSEVDEMSGIDLLTLDRLWIAYSQGKFGFSIQARLLDASNGRYDRLWPRIGWKMDGIWTRYPSSFTWSLDAPEGHMPLINQLRGVRLMDAILNHPALLARREKRSAS